MWDNELGQETTTEEVAGGCKSVPYHFMGSTPSRVCKRNAYGTIKQGVLGKGSIRTTSGSGTT